MGDHGVVATRDDLPIACTLGPLDGQERLQRWRALAAHARPIVRRKGHCLEVRYDDRPGVMTELEALVAAESKCCGFVAWRAGLDDGVPCLTVTAKPEDPEAIDAIAAVFDEPPPSGCG